MRRKSVVDVAVEKAKKLRHCSRGVNHSLDSSRDSETWSGVDSGVSNKMLTCKSTESTYKRLDFTRVATSVDLLVFWYGRMPKVFIETSAIELHPQFQPRLHAEDGIHGARTQAATHLVDDVSSIWEQALGGARCRLYLEHMASLSGHGVQSRMVRSVVEKGFFTSRDRVTVRTAAARLMLGVTPRANRAPFGAQGWEANIQHNRHRPPSASLLGSSGRFHTFPVVPRSYTSCCNLPIV